MARPTSFRLPEQLLDRLDEASRTVGVSVTSLVATLLDEGLKVRQFPGVVYRSGPTGRRAGLVAGPDVWEVIRDLRHSPGAGMKRIDHLADEAGLTRGQVRLAADFYGEFPEEVDAQIERDERAADRIRSLIERRERLLS